MMDGLSKQLLSAERTQDNNHLALKFFKLLSDGGIKILEDHKQIILHHLRPTKNQPEEYDRNKDDCHQKSSLTVPIASQKNKIDISVITVAYIYARNKSNKTPLHLSANIGNTEIVDLILKNTTNKYIVNTKDKCNKTPLHLSAENGHKDIVQILLKAGSKVDTEDVSKQSSLHLSAFNGHKEIVEILLKAGAKVDIEDNIKQTPLHLGALNGHKDVVEILLKAGATVDVENIKKRTPLHLSAYNGHKDVVEILLKAGAKVDIEDGDAQNSLHFAAYKGHKEVAEILLKAGAVVSFEDICKHTPLHFAACAGYKETVEILLKKGANVNATNKSEQTPLHLSFENNHEEIAEVLISAGASVHKKDINEQSAFDYKDRNKRIRSQFASTVMFEDMYKWIRSVTTHTKSILSGSSIINETECREFISTTVESNITEPVDSNTYNNAETPTGPDPLCDPPTTKQSCSHLDPEILNSIRNQADDHWDKFSPENKEGCETNCSHDVKMESQAGKIVMTTTINITNINEKNTVYTCEPGSQLYFSQPGIIAMNSKLIFKKGKKTKDDNSSDEEDSNTDIKEV